MMTNVIIAVILMTIAKVESAKILGLFPHPGKSHHDVFEPLLLELAARGHNMTVVSHFSPIHPPPPQQWRQISMNVYSHFHKDVLNMEIFDDKMLGLHYFQHLSDFYMLSDLVLKMCDHLTSLPEVRQMIEDKEQFDVILVEQFISDCTLGVAHLLGGPVVALQSHAPMPWTYRRFGQPNFPSYMPCIFIKNPPRMNFLRRVENVFFDWLYMLLFKYEVNIPEKHILERNLARSVPPLDELAQQTTALLSNTHFTLHGVKPLVPAIKEVGGMHIRKTLNPLPQDLEIFMNNSKHGVIIFSMGSMLKSSTFPVHKRDAFVEAFSTIKEDVIWKWEGDTIPGLSSNVLILKWLPQLELLHHPKTVAFISHGGLLGTTEAVDAGIPMLFIPVFADQGTNSAAAVENGLGVRVLYNSINPQRIKDALVQVLSQEMRESTKKLSQQWHDRESPLKVAVETVEYVTRYGQNAFRSPAQDLNFYQLHLIDIYIFIAALIFISLIIMWIGIQHIIKHCYKKSEMDQKREEVNINNNIIKYKQS